MYKKKIAIYVEGQTEQIILNQLIKIYWSYTGVKIKNIKLHAKQETTTHAIDFESGNDFESMVLFLIINVDGVGTLTSAIADRAHKQQKEGFAIIALRDLSAQDFDTLPPNVDRKIKIVQNFEKAISIIGKGTIDKIRLYFAVMMIEAWMLAFTEALSKWTKLPMPTLLGELRPYNNLEDIRSPSSLIKRMGQISERGKSKSFDEVMAFASNISKDELIAVYESNCIPSFNTFWDGLLLVSN